MRVGIDIKGIVQGVGFRPTVYRYARESDLSGFVLNSSLGVLIEIQGEKRSIESFIKKLKADPPRASQMDSFNIRELDDVDLEKEFIIAHSESTQAVKTAGISPDLATCAYCLEDIFNSENRRYSYPFTNCTNCGPRFTIMRDRPYDRLLTSMSGFMMCPDCSLEYKNPSDRRFHAQPVACSGCGPVLKLILPDKREYRGHNALSKTAELLRKGKVAAIKGLGGFNFACDPENIHTLEHLRSVKNRPHKAFALMLKNIDEVRKYCHLSPREERALLSPSAPIVLLRKAGDEWDAVSPDNNYLGVMLPYTPLHHLLLKEIPLLVMTSANKRDEPLAIYDEQLQSFMDEEIIDFFLTHDRPIAHRCDDSIVQFQNDQQIFIRRSRGFVPTPVKVENRTDKRVLSLGANLKNTFSLAEGSSIFLSQHIGDLTDFRNYEYQSDQIDDFIEILDIIPQEIRCDAHPAYENYRGDAVHVYHHHAHMLSVMAEHNLQGNVVGVICDGTGFGTDEAIWGFEFLQNSEDNKHFKRLAHLDYFPLPGGEKAIAEIDRIAIALVPDKERLPFSPQRIEQIQSLITSAVNTPKTSSLGRLFDGIAALTGIINIAEYEARGAIMLQREAELLKGGTIERYSVQLVHDAAPMRISYENLINSVLTDLESSKKPPLIAWKFHTWCAEAIVEVLKLLDFDKVVLSGGCFQNLLLLKMVRALLEENHYDYYINTLVPPNDGGISLGQAYY